MIMSVMKWSCVFAFLSLCVQIEGSVRPRHLYNFYEIVSNLTGRDPLDYNNYGHYCGLGGSGEPVDDVDTCCMHHDHCYGELNKGACSGYFNIGTYFISYKWTFEDGKVSCEHNEKDCPRELCGCDKRAAECFAAHEYHPEHKDKIL